MGIRIRCPALPSTRDVSKVTFAALRLPAGKFKPIFSSFSLSDLPPFFDFALIRKWIIRYVSLRIDSMIQN